MKDSTYSYYRLRIILIIFLMLAPLNYISFHYLSKSQSIASERIDIAVRNSSLSQQISFYATQVAYGAGENDKEILSRIVAEYDRNFYILKNGESLPLIENSKSFEKATSEFLPLFDNAEAIWLEYKQSVQVLLNGLVPPDTTQANSAEDAAAFIHENAAALLNINNEIVDIYVNEFDEKDDYIDYILYVELFVNLTVVGLGIWLIITANSRLVVLKNNKKDLAKELEKFKLAVDSASDHIIITDLEGVVLYANASVERITGYKPEEAIGKKAGALWKMPMNKDYYVQLWNTIKIKKEVFSGEIQNKRKNGEIYTAVVSISPVLDEHRNILFFVGIERDITEEKRIDQAKDDFLSIASHQLRTPLSSINWYAELILGGDTGKVPKQSKKCVEEIYKASKRMVELVNSFLNVSRLDLGVYVVRPEKLSFADIVSAIVQEMKLVLERKQQSINVAIDSELPNMMLDQRLITIILQNYLSNASKYSPEGASIELEMKKEGEYAQIRVTDKGIGIPTAQKDNIFSKLFRADNARSMDFEGTGLGLYIVRSIVDAVGGRAWFDSQEGKGSTFYATIPLSGMKPKDGTKELTL